MYPGRLCAAVLLVVAASFSSAFAVAEAGAPSQIIPPGARANGMGQSFVAIADDATAVWWNAGGVAFLKEHNFAFMHSQLVPDLASDVYYEYLGYTHEVAGVGTIGASLVYLTYGAWVPLDREGNPYPGFETVTSWEAGGTLTFAMPLRENLGVGLSAKYVYVDLAPAQVTDIKQEGVASSVAVDGGVLWKLPRHRLNLGASLNNLGPNIAFHDREQADPMPFTLRLGVAYTPMADEISNFIVTFDLEQSLVWLIHSSYERRRSEIYHLGAEYRYINLLAGRLGYIYDEEGDFSAPTYGLGFIYKDAVRLDYASVPQARTLGRVHRWSLSLAF